MKQISSSDQLLIWIKITYGETVKSLIHVLSWSEDGREEIRVMDIEEFDTEWRMRWLQEMSNSVLDLSSRLPSRLPHSAIFGIVIVDTVDTRASQRGTRLKNTYDTLRNIVSSARVRILAQVAALGTSLPALLWNVRTAVIICSA